MGWRIFRLINILCLDYGRSREKNNNPRFYVSIRWCPSRVGKVVERPTRPDLLEGNKKTHTEITRG